MRTDLALRYLLLRHLKRLAPVAPPTRFEEVTSSLVVTIARADYVVTWRTSGELQTRTFDRSAFAFYRRGDVSGTSDLDRDLATQNDAHAQEFAEAALGVVAMPPTPEPRIPHQSLVVPGAIVLAVVLATAGGLGIVTGTALLGLCLVELFPHGHRFVAITVVLLAAIGPPAAAGLLALGYGSLQAMSPDPTSRWLRLGLCSAAVVVAGARFMTAETEARFDWLLPVATIAAIGMSIIRSLHADHFRSVPLVLPLYALGLYVDGRERASLLAFGLLALAAVAAAQGHRIFPLQREHTLTPNG